MKVINVDTVVITPVQTKKGWQYIKAAKLTDQFAVSDIDNGTDESLALIDLNYKMISRYFKSLDDIAEKLNSEIISSLLVGRILNEELYEFRHKYGKEPETYEFKEKDLDKADALAKKLGI